MISQLNEIATTQKTSRDSHIKSDLKKYRKQKKKHVDQSYNEPFPGRSENSHKTKKNSSTS